MRKFRTTETFIEDAKKVHGDKYDYSEVVFTTLDKKSKDKMQTPWKCILPRSAWSYKRLRLSTLQSIATYTPM